jgi:hypothetical protein
MVPEHGVEPDHGDGVVAAKLLVKLLGSGRSVRDATRAENPGSVQGDDPATQISERQGRGRIEHRVTASSGAVEDRSLIRTTRHRPQRRSEPVRK